MMDKIINNLIFLNLIFIRDPKKDEEIDSQTGFLFAAKISITKLEKISSSQNNFQSCN